MIRDYWKRVAPPVFISNIAVAKGVGIDLLAKSDDEAPEVEKIEPTAGISIAELAARIAPPVPGGETLGASREVFRAMQGG